MGKTFIAMMCFVVALGTVSCRKNGYEEMTLAAHAMKDLKSFRIAASSASNSTSATSEYVCPDRVHVFEKRDDNDAGSEYVVIGSKMFERDRPDGSWRQEVVKRQYYGGGPEPCMIGIMEATGGTFGMLASLVNGTPKEPKYMGRETVNGAKCDSWGIPLETYAVHHPGQYVDPTPHWAAIVCIDPDHRVLQSKRDDMILRFYDFNQNITIEEPETASPEQQGSAGSSENQ